MFKKLVLCLFLLTAAFRAGAVDYTDIYYVPAEDGWGVNVVQSDTNSSVHDLLHLRPGQQANVVHGAIDA